MINSKKPKRKNGDGSWGKRCINKNDYIYFKKTYDFLSSPKTFYGKTEIEVKRKIKEFEDNRASYIDKKNVPTKSFYEYITYWLNNEKKSQIKRRTFDGYEDIISGYIQGHTIGKMQMGTLSKEMFQEHIDELSEIYARSTIKKVYAVIKQCLEYAVEKKHIPENYAARTKIPSEDNINTKKKEIKFLNEKKMFELYKEATRTEIINGIETPHYGINALICAFIAYTGIRIGECLALKWEDINLENDYMRVKNNVTLVRKQDRDLDNDESKYELIEGTTKTAKGYRFVPLIEISKEILLSQYEEGRTNQNQRVFLNKNRNTPTGRNVTRTLNAMQSNLGIERSGMHSLRHSFGSLLILHGNDIKVVSEILGHTDVSFTYNIYVHILDEQKIKATKLISGIDKYLLKQQYINDLDEESANILPLLKEKGIVITEIDNGMLGYIKNMEINKVSFTDSIKVDELEILGKDIYNEYYK